MLFGTDATERSKHEDRVAGTVQAIHLYRTRVEQQLHQRPVGVADRVVDARVALETVMVSYFSLLRTPFKSNIQLELVKMLRIWHFSTTLFAVKGCI